MQIVVAQVQHIGYPVGFLSVVNSKDSLAGCHHICSLLKVLGFPYHSKVNGIWEAVCKIFLKNPPPMSGGFCIIAVCPKGILLPER